MNWKMWAHDRSGKYWHVGSKFFVKMHMLPDPMLPVLVTEIDESEGPTHFGWISKGKDAPSMIFPAIAPGSHNKPTMFLEMCFPYGIQVAIDTGDGRTVALRIEPRELDPGET